MLGMVASKPTSSARTRKSVAIARAEGKLRVRKRKLSVSQEKHPWASITTEIAELFGVALAVCRATQRSGRTPTA
jgi:hypothetical protein